MANDISTTARLMREQAGGLAQRLATIQQADWQRPTPCEGWTVLDVMAHISSGAEMRRQAVERGLRGNTEPLFKDPGQRLAMMEAKRQLAGPALLADYRREMDGLAGAFEGLGPADLDQLAWHQTGLHPLPWFLVSGLGETAIHRVDVQRGLGDDFTLAPEVAEPLLGDYLARLPRLLKGERAAGLNAVVAFRTPAGTSAVRIAAGQAGYEAQPSASAPANLTIESDAATLVLMATGRLDPSQARTAGKLQAEGDTALLACWPELFRGL